jgi:hypothetical protein
VDHDLIINRLFEQMVGFGSRLLVGFDAALVRQDFRQVFYSNSRDFTAAGVEREQLKNAEALLWDALATEVSDLVAVLPSGNGAWVKYQRALQKTIFFRDAISPAPTILSG